MTRKPRSLEPLERLPFHRATAAATVAVGRPHGGQDGARSIRLPPGIAAHLSDPDVIVLYPQPDGTVVLEGLPLEAVSPAAAAERAAESEAPSLDRQ